MSTVLVYFCGMWSRLALCCRCRLTFSRANRAQYTDVSLQSVAEGDITEASLPSVQGSAEDEGKVLLAEACSAFSSSSEFVALEALQSLTIEELPDVFATPSQLGGDLITLTLLPRSRWQTLLNLEVIQVCPFCDWRQQRSSCRPSATE